MKKVKLTVGQHVRYVRHDSILQMHPEFTDQYPSIGETGVIRGLKEDGDKIIAAVEWDAEKIHRHNLWDEFPCAPRHGWYVEAGTLEPALVPMTIEEFI